MTDQNPPVDSNNVLQEIAMTEAEIQAIPAEEKMARVNAYRAHIQLSAEHKLSDNAARNAVFLLRAIRMKAVYANPHASKAAKASAAITPLDLGGV
ncbi:MAG: hypothetical protein L3J79_06960 [Candidatus Marinimicrobia bacterium]|nr:hypothetical protein [Candidatus Neomarinimicrobiota bacterium]